MKTDLKFLKLKLNESILKKTGKYYFIFISIILVLIISYKVFFYVPPLLDNEKRNFAEKTIDFLWFGWHFTKASIYQDYLNNNEKASQEFGKAGWYRKKYMEKKFNVNKDELISILNLYKNLKINSLLEKLYISLTKEEKIEINFLREAGAIFINHKNWKMAAEAFSKLINLNPDDFMNHYYLGLSYSHLKKLNIAIKHFEKAIEINSNFADAYYRIGYLAEKERDLEKAKIYFEKAINISPNHLDSLKALKKVKKKLE